MSTSIAAVVGGRKHLAGSWLMALGAALAIGVLAALAARGSGHGGSALFFACLSFCILLVPYFTYALTSFDRDVAMWLIRDRSGIAQVNLFFWSVYVLFSAGTGTFSIFPLLVLIAFTGSPSLLMTLFRRYPRIKVLPWLALTAIWAPFDAGWLRNIWQWPAGQGAYVMNVALAVPLTLVLFSGQQRLRDIRFRFAANWTEIRFAAFMLATFMLLALPVGFTLGFIGWHPNLSFRTLVLSPLGIFLFIAVPEELLFRGVLQNMIQKSTGRPVLALLTASLIFGATHLNNGASPDWRYFLLATIAGIFYGITYTRSRSLLLPALIHAAVDALWVLMFMKPGQSA